MKSRTLRHLGLPCLALIATSAEAQSLPAPSFDEGLYFPIDDEVLASTDGVRVVANGNAVIALGSPTFDAAILEDGEITFASSINFHGSLSLELAVEASAEFDDSVPLPKVVLPAFTVPGTNVEVTPTVYMSLKYFGRADASARVSLVVPFEATAQFGQRGQPVLTFSSVPEIGTPDLAAGAELGLDFEVGVVFMVVVNGIPIGGPSLTSVQGIDVHLEALPRPGWSADVTTEFRGGWALVPDGPAAEVTPFSSSEHLPGASLDLGLAPSRWSRIYDLGVSETSAGALLGQNGLVVMSNSSLGAWPWLSGLDAYGVPAWQTTVVPQPFAAINVQSLITLAGGDLLATGLGMRVQRYDATGGAIWSRSMQGGPSTLVHWRSSTPTPEGGAILAGDISYVALGTERCVLAELDASGNLLWVTELDLGPGTTNPELNAVSLTPAGQILAAGTVTYQDTPSPYDAALRFGNGVVLRLGRDGSALGAFAFGGEGNDIVTELAVFDDGSYAVGGYLPPARRSGDNWAWITSFDAQDGLRWSGTYAGATNGSWGHVSSLAVLPNGELAAAGGYGHPEYTTEAWLFRVDPRGTPRWFKTFNGPKEDTLMDVVALEDGLFAWGYTKSQNDGVPSLQNDLWAVRTSFDGMVPMQDDSLIQVTNVEPSWKEASLAIRSLAPTNVASSITSVTAPFAVVPAAATSVQLSQ